MTNSDSPGVDAAAAGLRHVSDALPGITRLRRRGKFSYRHPDGSPVRDAQTLARIRRLAIPPAYEAVWICPLANGHLQAAGRDARGRKQYRYHPDWRVARDATKFARMALFGRLLARIRRRVAEDLARPGLTRQRVLATVVRLLEATLIRIGNEEYARTNGTFGLTTLRNRHVSVNGTSLHLSFPGKHRIRHRVALRDRQLAAIVRRCRDLPGQELFAFVDADGERHVICSDDVNAYLREISGAEITAKDFRTWAATVLAARALRAAEPGTEAQNARAIVAAVAAVAAALGNTPAVCRKCYIHPAVFEAYRAGTLGAIAGRRLGGEERIVAALISPESSGSLPTH